MNIFDIDSFNVDKNYAITASAGTGKTYSIVKIVKKILDEKEININKLLIVTYTEKAAGELKQRIRQERPDVDVDNASIGTIHSFCKDTIKEFSLSALKPTNLKVIDESKCLDIINQYLRKIDRKTLLNFMNDTKQKLDDVVNLLNQAMNHYYLNDNNEEDKNIITLDINSSGLFIEDFLVTAYKQLEENNDVIAVLSSIDNENFSDEYEEFRMHFNNVLKGNSKGIINFINGIKEDYASGSVFTFKGYNNVKDDSAYFKELNSILKNRKSFLNNLFLSNHLKNIYLEWQEEKKKNKSQTFNDMIRFVRENVKKGGKLKKKLQDKFAYAIIDEFQDTNKLQWDIFKNVFLEDDEHRIIVVGDKKQSIYAFQGADVNVYEEAVKEIEYNGGIVASLNKNYRSSKKLVDMYNDLFKRDVFFDDYDKVESNDEIDTMYEGTIIEKPLYTIGTAGDEKDKLKVIDEEVYAKYVAHFIADCCTYVVKGDKKETKLQLKVVEKDDKHVITNEYYRNVSFKDFAVLGRTRKEFEFVERELRNIGIPFTRYKDNSLFTSLECSHWIALLSAISKDDFTGRNRDAFKKALFTRFFEIKLGEISSSKYDKDDSDEMQLILKWKNFADERKWEDLFESIIIDSKIEDRMANLTDIQSINVFRQIGEYCLSYLKENNVLDDLIEQLKMLNECGSIDDEEDNSAVVGKGTDFDCVNIMTIHASKGLEFPIVISVTGFKDVKAGQSLFTYHKIDEDTGNTYHYLSGSNKELAYDELAKEWIRLYYVSFTRPKYMLLLPYLDSVKTTQFRAYNNIMKDYIENSSIANLIPIDAEYTYPRNTKSVVSTIIKTNSEINKSDTKDSITEADQKNVIKDLIKNKKNHMTFKHSYSSLSHGKHDEEIIDDVVNLNKEGKSINESLKDWDKNSIQIDNNYDANCNDLIIPSDFPKGARIGTALHEVFEKFEFEKIDEDNNLEEVIEKCFKGQGYSLKPSWLECTKEMIKRVLNANLIKVNGNKSLNDTFKLKEINNINRKAEVEFNFNAKDEYLKNYCNGFVDLIFRNGEYYSILDWKSDKLNDIDFTSYSNGLELKNHVDDLYSIQRVLYAYCLIKWLKNFYPDMTEEEIFNNHFGGVYYVFLRGCSVDSGNGIYVQTWESFDVLEKAFNNIAYKKMGGK